MYIRLRRAAVGLSISCAVLLPIAAQAATRLVVVPVSVGGGEEPDAALMAALANGLRQNPQWAVEQGDSVPSLAQYQATAVTAADLARLSGEVETAARKGGGSDATEVLTRVRGELRTAAKKGARSAEADALLWRTSLLLVSALVGKDSEQATKVAHETMLLFPGRKPTEVDKLTPAGTKLFETPPTTMGARLKLLTRPEGCEVFLGATSLGKSPVEVQVLQDEAYWPHARCQADAAGATASLPKRVVVPTKESTRQEVLDAEFERGFAAEGLRRLRFASPQERRDLEESYARRLSERFDADAVVLASVGELSGADWLNARLYLRSGYLNRQGLVRLEAQRANALGRFLATGKDVPGVLKPEEAGALVASSRNVNSSERPIEPWYTDVAGWVFVGAGLTTLGVGRWVTSGAKDKQTQADMVRGDSDRQGALYREAQNQRFWGGVATVAGVLGTLTGVVLLLVPEYNHMDGEMFSLTPSVSPGGGGLILGGRF